MRNEEQCQRRESNMRKHATYLRILDRRDLIDIIKLTYAIDNIMLRNYKFQYEKKVLFFIDFFQWDKNVH